MTPLLFNINFLNLIRSLTKVIIAIKLSEACEFAFRATFAKTAITSSSGKLFARFLRVRKLEAKFYMFYPAPVPKKII